MSYELKIEDVNSITAPEMAFSTSRLLPKWEEIPDEFKKGNIYTSFISTLFAGGKLPDIGMELKPGFEGEKINNCVRSHLQSFEPKHEHKIAGVGFMLSLMCTLHQK